MIVLYVTVCTLKLVLLRILTFFGRALSTYFYEECKNSQTRRFVVGVNIRAQSTGMCPVHKMHLRTQTRL